MGAKNLRIETRQPQPVACKQTTASDVGAVFARLLTAVIAWIAEQGGRAAGAPFVRFLEIGTGAYRIEVGIPTAELMPASGDIATFDFPGGDVAVADHYGPYNTLAKTSAALREYVLSEGRSAAGPMWESYVTDPSTVSYPADLRTEVCIPLK